MLMQYFQSRTPGCTPRPSSWILHRYQLTILILIITILSPHHHYHLLGGYKVLGARLCVALVFSQFSACGEEGGSYITKEKPAWPEAVLPLSGSSCLLSRYC